MIPFTAVELFYNGLTFVLEPLASGFVFGLIIGTRDRYKNVKHTKKD